MKKMTLIILASVLIAGSQCTFAATKYPFYAGVSAGRGSIDTDGPKDSKFYDDDFGWKIYGGKMLDKYWGVELSYFGFGEFDDNNSLGKFKIDDLKVFALSLSPVIPIWKSLSLVGRIGFAYWDADFSQTSGGGKNTDGEDGFDIMLGVGPRITINEWIAVQGGWDRLMMDGDDVDLVSIGVRINTQ